MLFIFHIFRVFCRKIFINPALNPYLMLDEMKDLCHKKFKIDVNIESIIHIFEEIKMKGEAQK